MTRETRRPERRSHPRRCAYTLGRKQRKQSDNRSRHDAHPRLACGGGSNWSDV